MSVLGPGQYGNTGSPAAVAWNPARYGVETGTGPTAAGAIPSDPRGHAMTIMPFVGGAIVLWLLAERHARIRAGASASGGLS